MSLIYSGRLNGSTDCLWGVLHKAIISFVHNRDSLYQMHNQMFGNQSSIQEFETLAFQDAQGPVPVETAITNILDKHFHDIQISIYKEELIELKIPQLQDLPKDPEHIKHKMYLKGVLGLAHLMSN